MHDLRDGLPAAPRSIDLIVDTFVYKHQIQPETRRAYRAEMTRVLKPQGRVLLSVAEPTDEYYRACPAHPEPGAGPNSIVDPVVGAGSVLFSLEELAVDVADALELEMAWRKAQPGEMHGQQYVRRTIASLWRLQESQ